MSRLGVSWLLVGALLAGSTALAASSVTAHGPAVAAKKKCKKAKRRATTAKKCKRGSGTAPIPAPGAPNPPTSPSSPAPASLSITPPGYDYGMVDALYTPYHTATFTVTNGGGVASGTILDSVTGANPAKFQISSDACSGISLGAGASCTIVVSYVPGCDPADLSTCQTGTFSATLNVSASPGGVLAAPMTGTTFI